MSDLSRKPLEGEKHIFVIGLDDFNAQFLNTVRHAEHYNFHPLLDPEEIVYAEQFDLPALLAKALQILRAQPRPADAIVGYWDFPTTLMSPILRRDAGLPGPALESVLKCEHKYWSRLEQARVAPEHVPDFALVDPFDPHTPARPPLPFPFWIKPIKAHSALLGFVVRNQQEFESSITKLRHGIRRFSEPLNHIMQQASLPSDIAAVDGTHCVAEEIISVGRQCTLEGYVFDGAVAVYGIVDSIRGANGSSFERYQYPSTLPARARSRMIAIAKDFIGRAGLDCSPFNMEFFYDDRHDAIHLLETNSRISKSHCPLFEKVEGTSHHEVMVDVALGRPPEYPLKEGRFRIAAKFMLRRYGDHEESLVTQAPGADEARAIEEQVPGTEIQLHVRAGMKLGMVKERDSYSYELAVLFIGADDEAELLRKYEECTSLLRFCFLD